jgi:hypothetical protein
MPAPVIPSRRALPPPQNALIPPQKKRRLLFNDTSKPKLLWIATKTLRLARYKSNQQPHLLSHLLSPGRHSPRRFLTTLFIPPPKARHARQTTPRPRHSHSISLRRRSCDGHTRHRTLPRERSRHRRSLLCLRHLSTCLRIPRPLLPACCR